MEVELDIHDDDNNNNNESTLQFIANVKSCSQRF